MLPRRCLKNLWFCIHSHSGAYWPSSVWVQAISVGMDGMGNCGSETKPWILRSKAVCHHLVESYMDLFSSGKPESKFFNMARDYFWVVFWSGSIWNGRNGSPSMCFHVSDWFWQRHLSFALGVVQGTKTSGTTTALEEIALVKFQRCVPIKSHRIPCTPEPPQKICHPAENDGIEFS